MAMPIPPYSDDSERSVPNNGPDQPISQEQQSNSPRSELLSPDSVEERVTVPVHAGRQNSHRERRPRDTQHRPSQRRRDLDFGVPSDASPEELVQHLVHQTRQSHKLRRALHIAVERIQSDAEQAAAAERERVTVETLEHLRFLNDRRMTAQQESYRVAQDLRLSQFQLRAAQDKIARAEQMLRVVEHQRDDAEMAATEARAKARQLHQERIFQAAREEGRRMGFEEGLRKGRIDQEMMGQGARRREDGRLRPGPHSAGVYLPEDAVEQLSELSSPTNPLQNFDDYLPGNNKQPPAVLRREESPPPRIQVRNPSPPPQTSSQKPRPQSPAQPNPAPSVSTAPDPRAPSPSIQLFSLDIPPTSELQQQYNLNEEYPARSSQPWVTAEQHLAMTVSQPPKQDAAPQTTNASFEEQPSHPNKDTKPKKESWYRSISRRFQRKRNTEAPAGVEDEEVDTAPPAPSQSQSWYQRKPTHPPVHVRDFGALQVPIPPSSIDSQSISHLGIVGPPSNQAATGSERSFEGSLKPPRKAKKMAIGLHVINEDPASRTNTPLNGETAQPQGKLAERSVEEGSVYSNPNVMNEWRSSSATNSTQQRTQARPPRRPSNLTVPAPLYNVPVASPEPSPVGIQIESPSSHDPSDTHTLGSALPMAENNFLSPVSAARHLTTMRRSTPQSPVAPAPAFPSSPSSFQSILFTTNGLPPSAPNGLTPRGDYPKSPRPPLKPLLPSEDPPRPASAMGSARGVGASSMSASQPPEQRMDSRHSHRHSHTSSHPANPTLRLQSQPLPSSPAGSRSKHSTPQRARPPLPPPPPPPSGSDASHQRSASAHATPGRRQPQALLLLPSHDNTIVRMPSNVSMRSGGSYARYDPSTYLDPAYFNHAEGGGNAPPTPMRTASPLPRAHSRAASVTSALSYVTDPAARA